MRLTPARRVLLPVAHARRKSATMTMTMTMTMTTTTTTTTKTTTMGMCTRSGLPQPTAVAGEPCSMSGGMPMRVRTTAAKTSGSGSSPKGI